MGCRGERGACSLPKAGVCPGACSGPAGDQLAPLDARCLRPLRLFAPLTASFSAAPKIHEKVQEPWPCPVALRGSEAELDREADGLERLGAADQHETVVRAFHIFTGSRLSLLICPRSSRQARPPRAPGSLLWGHGETPGWTQSPREQGEAGWEQEGRCGQPSKRSERRRRGRWS